MSRPTVSPLKASLLVLCALGFSGCQAAPPPRVYAASDERPQATAEARWFENEANGHVTRAVRTVELLIKRRYYDLAIADLFKARDCYQNELLALEQAATIEKPIPFGRREALEMEIERLSDEIEGIYLKRPVLD